MITICHSRMLSSSTRPAENPSTGLFCSSTAVSPVPSRPPAPVVLIPIVINPFLEDQTETSPLRF